MSVACRRETPESSSLSEDIDRRQPLLSLETLIATGQIILTVFSSVVYYDELFSTRSRNAPGVDSL